MAMDIVGPQCNLHILHPAVCTKGIKTETLHCNAPYIHCYATLCIHTCTHGIKVKHGNIGNKMH